MEEFGFCNGKHDNRYDVMLLIDEVPVVFIDTKPVAEFAGRATGESAPGPIVLPKPKLPRDTIRLVMNRWREQENRRCWAKAGMLNVNESRKSRNTDLMWE